MYANGESSLFYYANEIVKSNNLENKITILKGDISQIVLPVEKVDIIISDFMGHFLLFESEIKSVIYARDKWLRQDGLMLPDRATINLAAFEDYHYKSIKLDFWYDVDEINMSIMRQAAIGEVLIDSVNKRNIMTSVCKILDLDLYNVKLSELEFASSYELVSLRDNIISGYIFWFDIEFSKLKNKIKFNTSPFNNESFWRQCICYFNDEIVIREGEKLYGSIAVRNSLNSNNSKNQLDFKISVKKKEENSEPIDFYQLYKLR